MLTAMKLLCGGLMATSTVALVLVTWAAGLGWFCPVVGAVGGWLICSLTADEDEEDV
jgi:hypothetical protein